MIMDRKQLEMSFDGSNSFRPHIRRRRQSRAQWWFARMREVVDQAFDWRPAPPPRPAQTYLTLAHGQ